MIGGFLKKIFGFKDKKSDINSGENDSKSNKKLTKLLNFFAERFEFAREEFFSIKNKCQNLRQTNYNLGMQLLEEGKIREAIFRFNFTKKFWPDLFDAYYQLAYCFVLENRPYKAKKILEELLRKNPNYDQKAQDLLESINQGITTSANAQ